MSEQQRPEIAAISAEQLTSLLRSVLALRHFTAKELAAYSSASLDEAQRFIASSAHWLESSSSARQESRWHMRLDAVPPIKRSIAEGCDEGASIPGRRAGAVAARSGTEREGSENPHRSFDDWYYATLYLVEDMEELSAEEVTSPSPPEETPHALATKSRRRGVATASIYLSRCEAIVWSHQQGVLGLDSQQVSNLASLRRRITALSGAVPLMSAEIDASLIQALQDWSVSLTSTLLQLPLTTPSVLETFSDNDLAHWIATDLGLATPWYQSALRAVTIRRTFSARWRSVQAELTTHCRGVLRLPACGPTLASVGLLAATLEINDLAAPLLGAVLLAVDGELAPSKHDQRVIGMVISRLAQAPTLSARVHLDAAFACELLLTRQADQVEAEALLAAVVLKDIVLGRPWMDRVLDRDRNLSLIFYRSLVKGIFIAARDPLTRREISKTLVTDLGYVLISKLFALEVANLKDSEQSHLLMPCESVLRSLQEAPMAGQTEMEYLPLPFPPESPEAISLTEILGLQSFNRVMSSKYSGLFGSSVGQRKMAPPLEQKFAARSLN